MNYSTYNSEGEYSGYEYARFNKRTATRTFSRLFLAISVYLLVSYAVIFASEIAILLIFGAEKSAQIFSSTYYVFGLQVVAMYLIAFPVFLLMTKGLPRPGELSYDLIPLSYGKRIVCGRRMGYDDGMSLGEFVALFFVSTSIMIFGAQISNAFTEYLSRLLGHTVENTTSDLISNTPLWLVVLVAVIIGPIVEELIFRKTFIDILGVYGTRLAIIVSSVAFGIFHGNFSQLLYASLLGLVLGYIYTKTHKVRYSILMHIIINFFGTIPTMLMSDSLDRLMSLADAELTEAEALNYFGDIMNVFGLFILQYGFAVAGLIIFVYCTAKRLYSVPDECEIRIPGRSFLRTTFLNFGVILFLILSLGQFLLSVL